MHVGAVQPGERAVVIDDLVATGGTLSAAINLLGKWMIRLLSLSFVIISSNEQHIYCFPERMEAEVVECACVIGLREVKVIFEQL